MFIPLPGVNVFVAAFIRGALSGGIATDSLKGALKGGVQAAVTYGIGHGKGGFKGEGWVKPGLSRAIAHATVGGISAELDGGKFGHGFASSVLTSGADSAGLIDFKQTLARVVANAIVAGTISELTGGKFANGAMSAAFRAAFNDLARPKTVHKEVTLDPEYEGPIQWNIVDGVNQGIADLGNALNLQGDVNAINKFNSLNLIYSEGNNFGEDFDGDATSALAVSKLGGNEIIFGSNIGSYLNKTKFGFRSFYHNSVVTNGGRGSIAFVVAHEFGHSIDSTGYSVRQRIAGKAENFANNYAKFLFPNFISSGIDMSDVRVR